jgi:hypothetical protein
LSQLVSKLFSSCFINNLTNRILIIHLFANVNFFYFSVNICNLFNWFTGFIAAAVFVANLFQHDSKILQREETNWCRNHYAIPCISGKGTKAIFGTLLALFGILLHIIYAAICSRSKTRCMADSQVRDLPTAQRRKSSTCVPPNRDIGV